MPQNIEHSNQWFKKFGETVITLRWLAIITLVVVDLLAIIGLGKIQLETSYDNWFLQNDPIMLATDEFQEIFGNDNYVAILLEADDVFSPKMLGIIRKLGEELVEKVPFADEIISLAEFEFIQGAEEGIEIGNIVPETIPADAETIEEIRTLAFSKNFWVNRLFSDDSQEAWIFLRLRPYSDSKKPGEPIPYVKISQKIDEILRQNSYQGNDYTIKVTGTPSHQYDQEKFFSKEAARTISLAVVIMILLLVGVFRSIRNIMVPLVSMVSSILWVFGAMGWLNITIDSIAITLPVYLGLAMSIGYSIHLFNFFKRHFYTTGRRYISVVYAVEQTGWPIFFTAITTMGALLSFYVVPVPLVRWMGLSCAATVLTVYFVVMTLTPVLLSFGKDDNPHPDRFGQGGRWSELILSKLSNWILRHSKLIIGVFGILVIIFLGGFTRMRVSMDFTRTYGSRVPFVQRFKYISTTKVGAYNSYEIMLRFEEQNRVKTPEILQKFDLLASEVKYLPLVKRTSSLLDVLKELNQVMHDDDPAYYRIPGDQELLSQLLLMYEMSAGTELDHWVDYEYTTLRMMIEITDFDTAEIEREFKHLEQRAHELFPDAEFGIVGDIAKISVAQNYIAKGEVRSFLIALCIVGILMIVVFGSIKTGLIGMIPNVAPAIIVGGLMGYANIPLDMMTMMVIPMLLGLAVDDTIHVISHNNREFQRIGQYAPSIQSTFKTVGKSIFMTSFILIAAFSAYMTSIANFFAHLGLLVITGVSSALLADYLVTPVLVKWTKPFGREYYPSERFVVNLSAQETE